MLPRFDMKILLAERGMVSRVLSFNCNVAQNSSMQRCLLNVENVQLRQTCKQAPFPVLSAVPFPVAADTNNIWDRFAGQ